MSSAKQVSVEDSGNLEDIEKQFAVKVVQHVETYWSLLQTRRGSNLKLTKIDDEIYDHLTTAFPDFDPAANIDEDTMKNDAGKKAWREFMMAYENRVADFSFGTILRIGAGMEYGEKETIFVPRMQFYAIEIARNRKGLNDWVYEKALQDKESKK